MNASILYVDANVGQLSALLNRSLLVCFDCEWPPRGVPSATLLQLALLALDAQSNDYVRHVVVVDVQQLVARGDGPVLRDLVRALLGSETLKLAHSLTNDVSALLRALNLPLEQHGSMRNAVDVRQLMSRLHAGGGFKHVGLSAMLETLLGRGLSKELQCSEWDVRPLTEAQIRYAANDASCLVDLFLYAAQLYAGGHSSQAGCGVLAAAQGCDDGLYCLSNVPRCVESKQVDPVVFRAFGQNWEYRRKWRVVWDDAERDEREGAAAAGTFWSKPRHSKQKTKNCKRDAKSRAQHAFIGRRPREVPWDLRHPADAAFVCDDMLGGLARELRLFGIDCEFVPTQPHQERFVTHRRLVEMAEEEARVILTRDGSLASRRISDRVYFVASDESKGHQAKEVIRAFECVERSKDTLMSRCCTCNGTLRLLEVDEKVSEWVPAGVRASIDEFWVCSRDKAHVYWQGGQYARSLERLTGQLDQMNLAVGSEPARNPAM